MADVHIAFAGNVGVGKTEFAQQVLKEPNRSLLLSFLKEGSIKTFHEVPDKRLLGEFYRDNERWGFALQMYYFALRLGVLKRIREFQGIAVEDRTIFEDRHVFGQTIYEMGNMHNLEFFAYKRMFKEISENFLPATLLVYLKVRDVKVLKRRIEKRGWAEEKQISVDYLQKLNDNYDKLFDEYPHPKIAINAETDMFEQPSYHTTVVCEIAQKLRKMGFAQKGEERPASQTMLDNGIRFNY